MARLKAFCVFDSKVGAYMSPFFMRSKGEAIRSFETAVNDPQTQFCKYPADFTLFEIGEFDEDRGLLVPASTPISLGLAVEFRRQQELDDHIKVAKMGGAK